MGSKVERAVGGELEFSRKHGKRFNGDSQREVGREYTVAGLDIEADSESAVPFLLAWDCNGLVKSFDINSWADCVRAFTAYSLRDSVNFIYNLQYDFEGMAKFLDRDIWVRLVNGEQVDLGSCKLRYVPKKAFEVVKGKKVWKWFDLWQYYLTSLDNAIRKNLPHRRGKLEFDTKTVSRDRYMDDGEYKRKIIEYCRWDASSARELGEIIVNGANRFVNTKDFYSSAGVSELYFRSNGFYIPWVPNKVHKAFMKTYHGGRFEIFKRGWLKGVTSIDIKSAYPYIMSEMPIVGDGVKAKWVQGYDRDLEALYGAYKVDFYVDNDYMGIVPKKINGVTCFPTGAFKDEWVDKNTLELMERLQVDYHIKDGVELFDREPGSLGPLIQPLYGMKEDKTNPPSLRYACKINLNGLYGKLIQLIDDVAIEEIKDMEDLDSGEYSEIIDAMDRWFVRRHTGKFRTGALFAPWYASHTTSGTRGMLLEKGVELGERNLVSMHTDSLQYIGGKIEDGTRLGDWEVEDIFFDSEMELVKCGMYRLIKDGKERKVKLRARGVGVVDSVIEDSYVVKRRFGMNQAIRRDWDKMNVIETRDMINDLNTDKKREWLGRLDRGVFERKEFVDSKPFVIA